MRVPPGMTERAIIWRVLKNIHASKHSPQFGWFTGLLTLYNMKHQKDPITQTLLSNQPCSGWFNKSDPGTTRNHWHQHLTRCTFTYRTHLEPPYCLRWGLGGLTLSRCYEVNMSHDVVYIVPTNDMLPFLLKLSYQELVREMPHFPGIYQHLPEILHIIHF